MDYRNIDEDVKLLHYIKRYYNDEINETQLRYILNEANYSEKEINNALNDYELIYIRPVFYVNCAVLIVLLLIGILLPMTLLLK